ncbi:efflux MFS transporter YdeE, partial [Cronobacter sakazakii]
LGWLGAAFNPMYSGFVLTTLPSWSLFASLMVFAAMAYLMMVKGMRVKAVGVMQPG